MESILPDIALTLHPNIGCRTILGLLEAFGSASAVYQASEKELIERTGINSKLAACIHKRETFSFARQEIRFVSQRNIRVLLSTDPDYPQRLLTCEDYPHVLYVTGNVDFNRSRWLAIVGTRKISEYGLRAVDMIVGELSELVPDLVIVSGLAFGVDVAAHRAAVKYGKPTIGILGQSLDHIYPVEHTDFARTIVRQGGAVLTEFATVMQTYKTSFVQRNRIIAGMTEGTLIIESPGKGGSLITADMADGYHRTVMAIPGRLNDPNSAGTNRMIRSMKAHMVCNAVDIIDALGWDISNSKICQSQELSEASPDSKKVWLDDRSFSINSRDLPGDMDMKGNSSTVSDNPSFTVKSIASEESTSEISTSVVRDASPEAVQLPDDNTNTPALTSDTLDDHKTDGTSMKPVDDVTSPTQNAIGQILDLLERKSPVYIDELSLHTQLPFHELSVILMEMVLSGKIRSLPGKLYLKN